MSLNKLLENKVFVYILAALCLGVFIIGFVMIQTAREQVNNAVDSCNAHYKRQFDSRIKNNPAFIIPNDLPLVFNFTANFTK